MSDYDVVTGVSGIGRYLLLHKENKEVQFILKEILNYLVELTKDKNIEGKIVPGWYIASKNQFLESEKLDYPNGNFNLGLAHGIPGPLALLSLCLMNGIEVTGQREAIIKITDWIIKFRVEVKDGFFWSYNVSWEQFLAQKVEESCIARIAWCYGTPSIARVIYLAGKAVENQRYIDISIKAIDNIFNLEEDKWGIYSSTFCHGYAGVLHILNLMYKDTKEERFKSYILKFLQKTLDEYNEELLFGFYNYERYDKHIKPSMNIGLLEGVSGICLVLLALIRPVKTQWDSPFLIV